jgi:hypothetical protein
MEDRKKMREWGWGRGSEGILGWMGEMSEIRSSLGCRIFGCGRWNSGSGRWEVEVEVVDGR